MRYLAVRQYNFLSRVVGHMRGFTELGSKMARQARHALYHFLSADARAIFIGSALGQDVDEPISPPIDHRKASSIGKPSFADRFYRYVRGNPTENSVDKQLAYVAV